ncbi:hypothetical protein [Rhizobium etli]|uniref:hypothetical protein n=1 Tax=Rhizobium etli TaxID=29449 RepID=UPI0012BBB49F|nr:hypothetical protein [Rhizobium etli]
MSTTLPMDGQHDLAARLLDVDRNVVYERAHHCWRIRIVTLDDDQAASSSSARPVKSGLGVAAVDILISSSRASQAEEGVTDRRRGVVVHRRPLQDRGQHPRF